MDNVSINKANCLYWLGRYAERAYKLSHIISEFYDRMVDYDEGAYKEFCSRLGITLDVSDKEGFLRTIISDRSCPSSIISALSAAYDNSIILREQIDTETVAYIQLAYNDVSRLFNDESCRIFDLQKVVDGLMGFWGAVDDYIIDDYVRDAIKAGKYVERIDLFCRFDRSTYKIDGCMRRLKRYIGHLDTDGVCSDLDSILAEGTLPDVNKISTCIGKLFQ
ncbi:MAG: alpha-E domain-containing protein [Clostridia bacterium]|nr:alpha-E domain-containing protein [Clostridia bacterium]